MRAFAAFLFALVMTPAFAQLIIDDGEADNIGSITIEEENNIGNLEFDVDLGARVQREFFLQGTRLEGPTGEAVRAYQISDDGSIIVGSIDDTVAHVTINNVEETDDAFIVVVSFIHKDGRHRSLIPSMITAHTETGANRCFSVEPIGGEFNPIIAQILIDRSGSMNGFMSDVRSSLTDFANVVPPNTRCRMVSFAATTREHTAGFQLCRGGPQTLSNLRAGGGTNLFPALREGYAALDAEETGQKFMMVITDGEDTSSEDLASVIAAKTAKTFVLWAGNQRPAFLGNLPDATLNTGGDISRAVNEFFKSIGEAIAQQQVLILPKTCPATQSGQRSGSALPLPPATPPNTAIVELDTPEAVAPASDDQAPAQQAVAPMTPYSVTDFIITWIVIGALFVFFGLVLKTIQKVQIALGRDETQRITDQYLGEFVIMMGVGAIYLFVITVITLVLAFLMLHELLTLFIAVLLTLLFGKTRIGGIPWGIAEYLDITNPKLDTWTDIKNALRSYLRSLRPLHSN